MNRIGEMNFIDALSVASFLIALENLDLNLAQEDLDAQTQELDRSLRRVVDDIHNHLSVQDSKLNIILNRLEAIENGANRNLFKDSFSHDKRNNVS